MYLMYVDESGDSGLVGSPSRYFVLTGLVIHELQWRETLEKLIIFRHRMKAKYLLPLRDEIHSAHLITKPGKLVSIKRNDRLAIIRAFADEIGQFPGASIINVVVDKMGKAPGYDVFEIAWRALIQRFENGMDYRNFSGSRNPEERGMIIPDKTDVKKLTDLLRKLRRFNPIPHSPGYSSTGFRSSPICSIIEDPFYKDSESSYFIQAADLSAFLLYQHISPNQYMKKNSGQNYFKKLQPVLYKHASRSDPDGIVRL